MLAYASTDDDHHHDRHPWRARRPSRHRPDPGHGRPLLQHAARRHGRRRHQGRAARRRGQRATWASRRRRACPRPFLAVNRNKRGITLDLKQPDGVAVLKRLVATADVLVENYRPGVARRLGVDYETLAAVNPRLIYCSISGFGQTGPYAYRGGYDLIAQGMSRHHERHRQRRRAAGEGGRARRPISAPASSRVLGILCALRARRRHRARPARRHVAVRGRPRAVGLGGDRVLVHGTDPEAARHRAPAERALPGVPGQRRLLHGRGGQQPSSGRASAQVLGLEHLTPDPRFAGVGDRVRTGARARAGDRARDRRARRAPTGSSGARRPAFPPARSTACRRRWTIRTRGRAAWCRSSTTRGAGRVKALGNPVKLSRSPARLRRAAPRLGETPRRCWARRVTPRRPSRISAREGSSRCPTSPAGRFPRPGAARS